MKRILMAGAALALAACSPKTAEPPKSAAAAPTPAASGSAALPGAPPAVPTTAPAGTYSIDPSHTTVAFRVSHLGLSNYTGRFAKAEGKLAFDPANPGAMTVEATIDPRSLDIPAPPAGFHDTLMGKDFLAAAAFPAMTFRSTKVEVTGPNTARVTGDFTLRGVTRPVTLETTFNGGYAPNAMDGARIGFSAHGAFKRSDFGMGYGVPAPGSNMGVGDQVAVTIETEFTSGKPKT